MTRFLFVVPPLVGHVNPTVGVAAALVERGHQVAWAGAGEFVRRLVGPDAAVYNCAVPESVDTCARRPPGLRGPAWLKFLCERFFIPLAEAMVPGVAEAVERFAPDVLVVDLEAFAGWLVAERMGLPWATSATNTAVFTDPFSGTPKIEEWLRGIVTDLRHRCGVPDLGCIDKVGELWFSPHLVLAFTTSALLGSTGHLGAQVRLVGPSIAPRPSAGDFPWDWLDAERPAVLVSLGTVNSDTGARFLDQCARALAADPDRQAVIVDPAGMLGAVAEHMLVQRTVPQLRLLSQVDAVVCHAGHNTVCETLSHGLPLVVAPIRDDQPLVAQQVVEAGAGIRLRFSRATAAQIGPAVEAVLAEPSYRQAARRVGETFRAAGGAVAAARHLEELAACGACPLDAGQATAPADR
ncbi:MAG: nucleotide disphospho-sugar-binding domain-containing protein [Pseudonocardiaceae bacterium]